MLLDVKGFDVFSSGERSILEQDFQAVVRVTLVHAINSFRNTFLLSNGGYLQASKMGCAWADILKEICTGERFHLVTRRART